MAETLNFTVQDDAWTLIADGAGNVIAQRRQVGAVLIHVGATAPALEDPALMLSGSNATFSAGGLGSGDRVYARADAGTNTLTVIRS